MVKKSEESPGIKMGTAKERILSSAFELFAEKGYGTTTTKDIAHHAGVNEVTVFRSYGSKEALFREVIKEKMPVRTIMTAVDFDMDVGVEEMIVLNAHRVLGILKQNRHFFMMLVGEVWRHPEVREYASSDALGEATCFLAGHFRTMMSKGMMREMDPTIAARAWLGMVQSYFIFNHLLGTCSVPEEEEDRILRGLADVFINGVRGGGVADG